MESGRIVNIVATECQADQEAAFNKWYDEVHVPMLLKFQGMTAVTRYKLAGGSEGQARYLAIYEFQDQSAFKAYEASPELAAARAEISQTWKVKGFDTKWRAQYQPLRTWTK